MAEGTTTEPAERADDTTTPGPDAGKPDIPPEVKRALTKANKEAEQLRLKLKEYEDRDKSELEKLTEAQAAAERRAHDAELRALRLEVAAEKRLTPALARRLQGSTREELEADADEILREFPTASGNGSAPKAPKPDPSQGSRGAAPNSAREAALAEVQKRFGAKSTVT